MSQLESAKISLSKLRGKSSNQSVPSISFRFDPSSNDLTEVLDNDFDSQTTENSSCSSMIEETEEDKETPQDCDKSASKFFNQRSSSLDSPSGPAQDVLVIKSSDQSSFISRITKTFEHKISEIRNEKREKELKGRENRDLPESILANIEKEDTIEGNLDPQLWRSENKEKIESISPIKSKSSIVQDITEHTNKIKSEFQKSIIKPRLSELRNRKNSRDSLTPSKPKGSLLTSLLGRDDGIVTEELLKDCEKDIDRAVEAEEFVPTNAQDEISSCHNENATPDNPSDSPANKSSHATQEIDYRGYFIQSLVKYLYFLKREYSKYIICALAACFVLPLPPFLTGTLFGFGIASMVFIFILKFILPSNEEEERNVEDSSSLTFVDIPMYNDYPLYKGWMNELVGDYFPENYHVSLTHSVFLRLQGSTLQLDNPRKRIGKHAKPNEELNSGGFVHHRKYDLSGCQVLLLPKNLPRKWLWSRKYPICLHLRPKSFKSCPVSLASTPSKSPFQSPFYNSEKDLEVSETAADPSLTDEQNDFMISSFDLSSYEEITEEMCSEKSLCFFARSDREKDDWFRRFVTAAGFTPKKESAPSQPTTYNTSNKTAEGDFDVPPENMPDEPEKKAELSQPKKKLSFDAYMARILHKETNYPLNINWFNCLVGRILFDCLHNQFWAHKIQERIQRKLSKLHIPYFIEDILVCGVDLGSSIPQLSSVNTPSSDARGLWVDFQASYTGSFTLSLETKVNLMKLKERAAGSAPSNPPSPGESPPHTIPRTSTSKGRAYSRSPSSDCVLYNIQFDTDTDDSVESSSEEEHDEEGHADGGATGGPTSKRLWRIVDTVAASRYFQHAAEWKVLQRAMQGVSNTRIELTVEVKHLAGRLAVNIPPPPADRIWYGFRGTPQLDMVARPCLGDRALNLPFLPEFIQKQLRLVFEKVFVLPNMDDLVIPVMSPLLPGQSPPPRPWEAPPRPWEAPPSLSPKASPINTKSLNAQSMSFKTVSKSLDTSSTE